jgi:MFS family permease
MRPSLLTLGIYRAVCGLTNSLVFLICMRQAPMWFPRKISVAIGLMITVGMLGGMMEYPFSLIVARTSWQVALLMDAGLGVVLFGVACLFLRDAVMPQVHERPQLWKHFKKALSVKENFLCGVFTGCLNLPVLLLGATWGDRYLMGSRGLSLSQSSLVISMIFFGMIFASPFFGWFADFCRSRRQAMVLGSIASLAVIVLIVFSHSTHLPSLLVLFFLLGFLCTSQIISYTVVNEVNSRENASTAMSLVSILIYGIAAIGNPLFGEIVRIASVNTAIFILPIAFGLSVACGLFASMKKMFDKQ